VINIREFGKRELIKRICQRIRISPNNIVGLIDDAAVYDAKIGNEYLVVTTDRIAFPYGLKYGIDDYGDLGKYFAASVFSDVFLRVAEKIL